MRSALIAKVLLQKISHLVVFQSVVMAEIAKVEVDVSHSSVFPV
jgi:hypothetical protein